MKIIFESEEEKRLFIADGCPDDIPLITYSMCDVDPMCEMKGGCKECWKRSGVILEVDEKRIEVEDNDQSR